MLLWTPLRAWRSKLLKQRTYIFHYRNAPFASLSG